MNIVSRFALALAGLALAACEDVTRITQVVDTPPPATPPVASPPPPPPPENLEQSLNSLGVPTNASPRVSNEGVPLPDTYAPFGATIELSMLESGEVVLGAPQEMALMGFSMEDQGAFLSVIENVPLRTAAEIDPIVPGVLSKSDASQAPWAREQAGSESLPPLTLRDATGSDVDGDGLAEFVTVRFEAGQLVLGISETDDPASAPDERIVTVPVAVSALADVRITGGDFDDDRRDELALALTAASIDGLATATVVLLLDDSQGDFAIIGQLDYQSVIPGADVHVVLVAGSTDYDVADELVVMLNELVVSRSDGIPDAVAARLFAYDDAGSDFEQLIAASPEVVTPDDTFVADVVNAAIGDFDGDDINEILVAGISGLTVTGAACNDSPDGTVPMRYLAILFEFDGLSYEQSYGAHTADQDSLFPPNCSDDGPWTLRFPFINAVNLDADRQSEFHINQYVMDGLPAPGAAWGASSLATLPRTVFFPDGATGGLVFDRSTAVISAGDVNGDGRGDIVSARGGVDVVSIFSNTDADGFYRSGRLLLETADATYATSTGAFNPHVVIYNGDMAAEGDVKIMHYESHVVDFSEPIVLAALAAPPCIEDIEQNHDACVTSWGKSETVSLEGDREFTFSAGFSVGVSAQVDAVTAVGIGLSVNVFSMTAKLTLARESGRLKSESYEVSKTVSFETGAQEDSVVFASIPYDVYRYKVVTNTLDEALDGTTFYDVGLPREAVVRIATTSYYNSRTTDTATKIDGTVFAHTVGDVSTYPTLEDRALILDQNRSQVEQLRTDCPFCWQLDPEAPSPFLDGPNRTFDPFAALPGLVSEAVGVGQGGGATEVGIELNTSNSTGNSLARSWEGEVEFVIYGFLVGFQVGGGASFSTSITRSEGKAYVGSVGSISDRDFNDNQYAFGMFTYLQADPNSGHEFEVINYWVE